MKDLIDTISKAHPTIPGWCPLDKACVLASMVFTLRPQVTVEIGVYGGRSFIPMALAHKAVGYGVAYGIDAWSNVVAVREQPSAEHREWWSKYDIERIYNTFIYHIQQHNLQDFTRIIRNESRMVQPPNAIDILHIDGSHEKTTITDAVRFGPKVVLGGFCIMDDTDGVHGPCPAQAEQRLIAMGFKKLYCLGTGSVLQRIR